MPSRLCLDLGVKPAPGILATKNPRLLICCKEARVLARCWDTGAFIAVHAARASAGVSIIINPPGTHGLPRAGPSLGTGRQTRHGPAREVSLQGHVPTGSAVQSNVPRPRVWTGTGLPVPGVAITDLSCGGGQVLPQLRTTDGLRPSPRAHDPLSARWTAPRPCPLPGEMAPHGDSHQHPQRAGFPGPFLLCFAEVGGEIFALQSWNEFLSCATWQRHVLKLFSVFLAAFLTWKLNGRVAPASFSLWFRMRVL